MEFGMRPGEPLQSIPKRRKPVLIHRQSHEHLDPSTLVKRTSQTNPSAQFLSQTSRGLEHGPGPLAPSASFNPHQLLGSFTSIQELTVSCVSKMSPTLPPQPEEAGRLLTTDSSGVTQILIIKLNEHPWSLGRNHRADLTIDKPTVSNWHCKLYAVSKMASSVQIECDTGERIVCLEVRSVSSSSDLSTNGIRYNNRLVRKKAVILNNGDRVEIAGQVFSYSHSCPPGNYQGSPSTSAFHFKPTLVGKYQITERVLGSGFFSVVHLAINQETGAQLACKIIKRQTSYRQSAREVRKFQQVVQQEVKLNASLDHLRYFVIDKPAQHQQNYWSQTGEREDVRVPIYTSLIFSLFFLKVFELACISDEIHRHINPENSYIFLELVTGGDLFGYVTRNKRLDENEAKFISYQLALALQVCIRKTSSCGHICTTKNRYHIEVGQFNIKPENILLAHHGPDPRVLLADFGAARLADKAFCSMQGTMSYAAPVSRRTLFMIPASSRWAKLNSLNNFPPFSLFMKEVLTVYTRPQGYDGKKADIWSLGVCVYTMICGFHPFDNNGNMESAETERREICKMLKYNIEPTEVQFVKSVLKPATKDEAVSCMSGGGYQQARDVLKKMFESEPRRRICASEILAHAWIRESHSELDEKYQKRVICQK
ncbi:CAMK/RAD53 protein kinase [Puccinia sorghi]|uniref:CAMK/RAD53 protein kinase n=1 Tax=Puccinia sorghi TaxID=27349 RepID=A0A0L6VML8_9BASI|nr:CAMK/RAD53 protein kinase [Puccinia sorghi]